jgi:hypothetical protein
LKQKKIKEKSWPFFGEWWGWECTIEHRLGSWGSSVPNSPVPLGWEGTSFFEVVEDATSE